MRILLLFISFYLIAASSFGQISDSTLVKIRLSYQSSFETLPELYEIKALEREVDCISPITQIPSGESDIKTKKYNQKKWASITELIDSIDFDLLESSSSQGLDGAWFTLHLEYSNKTDRTLKIWSGHAPESLTSLHLKLNKEFKR